MNKLAERLIIFLFGLILVSPIAVAAPGAIASEPLLTSARVDPNIMLALDSSGSMNNIVEESPFDPNVTYFNCPGSMALAPYTDNLVKIQLSGRSGQPYFCLGQPYSCFDSTTFDWGVNVGTDPGPTGHSKRCFQHDGEYKAKLYADANSGSRKYPSGYADTTYTGNYLNWYFGTSPHQWGSSARNKPGTQRRLDVQRDVAIGLVNQINHVRVGLTRFDGNDGADILVGVNDIETHRNTLVSNIQNIPASGNTPLAEMLQEIGRYFVQGYNNNLTLHPGTSYATTKRAYTVFDRQPRYNSGVVQRSPIQYFCQKNFNIIVTDGRPSADTGISASSGLRDYDRDCLNATPSCEEHDQKPSQNYENGGSDYLDDVAMALFDMDLRPDLTDNNGDPVKNNMITYTIGFADRNVQNDALLRDAAGQGGGIYYAASDTTGLIDSLDAVVASIASSINTAAAATFNAANLTSDSAIFSTQYDTTDWTGNLIKFPVDEQGNIGAAVWEARTILDNTNTNNRFIFTYNPILNQGVPFRDISQLSAAQVADLNTAPGGGNDGRAQQRLNFLNGDRSLEGTVFRTRTHILGDTVDSAPGFVGAPESHWPDIAPFPTATGKKHSDFASGAAKNRTPMVYVGDNGGFLQGFRADNGVNILSFMPSNLFSDQQTQGLHYLTDPNYQHRFYVDLSPAIQDAYIPVTPGGGSNWRTVLVGGERNGGRGYFALDVTDPGRFLDSNADQIFLWEFSNVNDPDLGFTFSDPTIGLMNNGRWAAIFGNGYNNTGSGRAKLFIVYLDGGLDGTWTPGVDYVVLDTRRGTLSNLNGLSTPAAIDTDGNRTIDRIYAGDLFGNMWAFDVSSSNPGDWGAAYGPASSPRPLFRGGNSQPITAKPIVVNHPSVGDDINNEPNVMVLFGTGQFITSDDKLNTDTQRFYGIWDSGTGNLRRNRLVQQTFVQDTDSIRIVTDRTVPYTATGGSRRLGWYISLPDSGERVVTTPQVRGGIVFFTTMIPDTSTSCSFGGSGWIMAVKVENGGEPDEVVINVNNDDKLTDADKINDYVVSGIRYQHGVPMQSSLRGDYLFTPGSDGTITRTRVLSNEQLIGRISWQELTSGRD